MNPTRLKHPADDAIGNLHPKAAIEVGLAIQLGYNVVACVGTASRRGVLLFSPLDPQGARIRPLKVQPNRQFNDRKLSSLHHSILTYADPELKAAYEATQALAKQPTTPAPKEPAVPEATVVPKPGPPPATSNGHTTELRVISEEPSPIKTHPGQLSPTSTVRRWSDGHTDAACAAVDCDFYRHRDPGADPSHWAKNPVGSVGSHWGQQHDRRKTVRKFPEVPFAPVQHPRGRVAPKPRPILEVPLPEPETATESAVVVPIKPAQTVLQEAAGGLTAEECIVQIQAVVSAGLLDKIKGLVAEVSDLNELLALSELENAKLRDRAAAYDRMMAAIGDQLRENKATQ